MTKILGSSLPNIPWEDRPAGYKLPVWRYSGNPIIGRDGNNLTHCTISRERHCSSWCHYSNYQRANTSDSGPSSGSCRLCQHTASKFYATRGRARPDDSASGAI